MASPSTTSDSKQSSQRRKSCDTICSTNSSCFLNKRKPVHPFASSIRTYMSKSSNSVKQRVLSARLLRLRSLQNQLNDANFHLAELQQENRALKNLQTRQDKALSKYEGTNADLPKLLRSHEEEIRVLVAKNKTLRKNLKDATDQLKIKEEELANVREQLKNLVALTKNKNLGERQTLSEEIENLKFKLKSSDDKINLLNRKLLLETKNYKYKLNTEITKNKQSQKELAHALNEIDRLTSLLESKGKFVSLKNPPKRFVNINHRQSISLTCLTNEKLPSKESSQSIEMKDTKSTENRVSFASDMENNHIEHLDVKLEPLAHEKGIKGLASSNGVMSLPSENIKVRLSTNSSNRATEIEQLTKGLEKINVNNNNNNNIEASPIKVLQRSRPNSSQKLEKLTTNDFIYKTSELEKNQNKIEQDLDNYRSGVISTVQNCTTTIKKHKEDYENVKMETEKLLESLRETDTLNSKLRHANFLAKESLKIPNNELELVNQIWNDEYAFRKNEKLQDLESQNGLNHASRKQSILHVHAETESVKEYDELVVRPDRNGNVVKKESELAVNDKKSKLLATLRAIDNGEEIDDMKFESNNTSSRRNTVVDFFNEIRK